MRKVEASSSDRDASDLFPDFEGLGPEEAMFDG